MWKDANFLVVFFSLAAFSAGQLDNFGATLEESLKPLRNLGSRINADVNRQLAGLENLGQNIEAQVYQELEPVRILESILKVKFGRDGTTVATFSPGDRKIIVKNGESYNCNGQISGSSGECMGTLEKAKFQKNEDFCYATNKNIINDWYCITPTHSTTISVINNKIVCETQDNSPRLLIKRDEFDEMCKNVATSVTYKYFTNSPLKHLGNGLICSGNNPQICFYSESTTGNLSQVIISS